MQSTSLETCLVFDPGHVPGSHGVQAAEFLGCQEVQADVIKHLQTLLIEIMERKEDIVVSESSSLDSQLAVNLACTRDLHSIQVCACIALLLLLASSEISRQR
jgi:hypothetical protein